MRAVILAGGRGTRLTPYSAVLPKPLLPIGDMPILELLMRQLKQFGVERVTLAVGYLAPLVRAYFGTGERIGLPVDYSQEGKPLGTAGPLRLVPGLDEAFLVMNGDLLTDLDVRAMAQFHRRQRAAATVGICERDVQIDFGVVETDGAHRVVGYREKPTHHQLVSMGVYVLEPRVLRHIAAGRPFDLPDLISTLLAVGEPVAGYLHPGYWLDIGRPEDYQRAQDDFPTMKRHLLGMGRRRPRYSRRHGRVAAVLAAAR